MMGGNSSSTPSILCFPRGRFSTLMLDLDLNRMRLDAKGLEFRGEPFTHFVDFRAVGGIRRDTRNRDSCREAIDEWFLERVDTTISLIK